ncbi:hypothetical protein OG735_23965 [Streptomyces sp. NBC_01210]|uniref:hypothetical protein n=1 Tax=Streptomyces sp. NBC_01210 TaxID=2903774 RepID=UPI002E15CD60|nr:hypothetical protein OG735_23965 [Streptomyces sp. NBC_01210]
MRNNTVRTRSDGLVGRLNADWLQLSQDKTALLAVRDWYGDEELVGPQCVLDALRVCLAHTDQDRLLLPPLRAAAAGGARAQLGARVVVQAMLPKAIRIARSQMRPQYGWEETISLTVGALYEVIRTYPVDRRAERIAANLALDTLRLTRCLIAADATVVPLDVEAIAGLTAPDASPASQAELALLLAQAGEYELLADDEPGRVAGWDARAELVELLVWALDTGALDVEDARLITRYYRDSPAPDTITSRPSNRAGASQRQRRSRAVRRLTHAASDRFATAK